MDVEQLIAESGAEAVAVCCRDLETGDGFEILPDEVFHAASTMKVCVLMELFHQAHLGELGLDDEIVVKNEFKSIVDGTAYNLGIEDDAEQGLYGRIGEVETLLGLAEPMITVSSNLATNLLVEILGADRITGFMRDVGAPGLIVRRGVEDGKAYRLGLNNTVTARSLTEIAVRLAKGELVSPSASEQMLQILHRQKHRRCIPAGLPEGVRVAHKTGWNSGICHDFGLVFPEGRAPYVLTVLTRGLDEKSTGQQLIAAISKVIWDRRELIPLR